MLIVQAHHHWTRLNWISLLREIARSFSAVPPGNFSHLFTYSPHFFWLICFVLAVWSAGHLLIRCFKWSFASWEENWIFSVGLGLGFFSLLAFLFSAFHWLNRILFLVILFGMAAFAVILLIRKKNQFSLVGIVPSDFGYFLFSLLIITSFIVMAFAALLPVYFYDQLVYHYAIPSLYIQSGGVVKLTSNLHSAYPMGWEMLYLFMLEIKDETAAQLVNLIPWAGCMMIFRAYGRRFQRSSTESLLAMAIFGSMPMALTDVLWGGVDLGWTFFQLASFYAALIHIEKSDDNDSKQWLILSALFAGFALSTKYLSLIGLGATLMVIAFSNFKKGRSFKISAIQMALYFVIALVPFLPYCIKNLHHFCTPLYPLLTRWVPSCVTGLNFEAARVDMHPVDLRHLLSFEGIGALALGYLRGGGPGAADYMGTPVLICLILLCVYCRDKNFFPSIIFLSIFWIALIANTSQIRFLMPAFAVIVMAGSRIPEGIQNAKFKSLVSNGLWSIALIILLIVSLGNVMKSQGWKAVFGLQSKEEYLSHDEPSGYRNPYFAAMKSIGALSRDAKILFIGEARTFYCPRPAVSSSAFDQQLVSKWVNDVSSGEELYQKIAAEKITHFFLNVPEARAIKKDYDNFRWTSRGMEIFDTFWRDHVREVSMNLDKNLPEMHLYTILPEDQAKTMPAPFDNVLELENNKQK